jgi:hypothetical protein
LSIADYKSIALATYLEQELKLILKSESVAFAEAEDLSGYPLINIGDLSTAGNKSAVIRIRPISWTGVETSIPGVAQPVYGPHTIEMVYENVNANTAAFIAKIELLLPKRGTNVSIYRTAAATKASVAGMIPANLLASIDIEPYQGLVGNV